MIPYGKQEINNEDIESIIKVLKSDFLTQGPLVPKFEESVSQYCGSKYSIALTSATAALHLSCMALELKKGDYLWTSPISFVASANCARYCGANVDFVDIDPLTYNLDPKLLEEKLINAEKNNILPKIVVPVHLCGHSADMQEIYALSKRFKFKIIEDASHAIGGRYKGYPVGSCKYSDITVFSFHPVKIITTGEGGIATTNNIDLAKKICKLRSHGITRDKNEMINDSHGEWYYEQQVLGYNYRMTDIQASLGISQLKRISAFILKREKIAQKYNKEFKGLPIKVPNQNSYVSSSRHLYVIRVDNKKSKSNHSELFSQLRKMKIYVNIHYIPIHLQPYYRKLGFNYGDFPNAERYYQEALSLPIYTTLKDEEQKYVIESIKKLTR